MGLREKLKEDKGKKRRISLFSQRFNKIREDIAKIYSNREKKDRTKFATFLYEYFLRENCSRKLSRMIPPGLWRMPNF